MFHAIYAGSTSACFELDNTAPFYAPAPYAVLLDGQAVMEGKENVFSLYGLTPDTVYSVTLRTDGAEETIQVRTAPETCAVSVRAFGAAGDGMKDDTAALQAAIAAAEAKSDEMKVGSTIEYGSMEPHAARTAMTEVGSSSTAEAFSARNMQSSLEAVPFPPFCAESRFAASMPLSPGISMSMTTRSPSPFFVR